MAYKLHFSDYPGTDTGPPDPERWVGPPGPTGPMGPQGVPGPPGPNFPEAPADGPIYGRGGATPVWTPTLPLTGGTVSGMTNFNAGATHGASGNNILTIAPGATTATTTFLSTLGSIGLAPASVNGNVINLGAGTGALGVVAQAQFLTGGNANDGTTGNTFNVLNKLQANFYRTPVNSYTLSAGALPVITSFAANYSGVLTGTGLRSPFSFQCPSVSVDATGQTNGWWQSAFQQNFTGTKGSIQQMALWTTQTGDTLDSPGVTFFVNPLSVLVDLEHKPGAGSFGNAIGCAAQVTMGALAQNWAVAEAAELAVSRAAGATGLGGMSVLTLFYANKESSHAAGTDTFLTTAKTRAASGVDGVGTKTVWQLGRPDSVWPLDPAVGWIVQAAPQVGLNPANAQKIPQAAVGGLDFWNINFSTTALRTSGVSIGNAAVRVGSGSLSQGASGPTFDATGSAGAISAIVNAGTLYQVNDQLYDGYGGIILVTAVSGGAITAASYIVGREPYVFGAAPSNPIGTTGGSGDGTATFNVTWTARTSLSIQPSGGATTFGGPVTLPAGSTGAFLPLTGGTVTGASTFSAAGTALTVTNNATVGGVATIGSGSQNIITAAPGATTAATSWLTANGTAIGIGSTSSSPFGVNIGYGPGAFGNVATANANTGGNANDGSTGNVFTVNNILRSNFYRTPGNTYNGTGGSGTFLASFVGNYTGNFSSVPGSVLIQIPTDQAASGGPITLSVAHNFGGGATAGGRLAAAFQLSQVGATNSPSAFYVVANLFHQSNFNSGGTGAGTLAGGYASAINPKVRLLPGATYFLQANALGEVNITTTGTQQSCTIAGSATAGDVITLTFAHASIAGSPVSIPYTVGAAQSIPSITYAIQAAIWANVALRNAGVSATVANNTGNLTLCWPFELGTVTVASAVSGAATETVTLGSVVPGASADVKLGTSFVRESTDTGPPMTDSATISVGDQPTTPAAGWRSILLVGGGITQWPLAPRGTIINARPTNVLSGYNRTQPIASPLATAGIDFQLVNFTQQSGNALLMPGWRLDGSGNTFYGSAKIGMSATGLTIDSAGWTGSGNASVVAGGGGGSGSSSNNYFVGEIVYDDLGGQHVVAGVNPATGAVTSLTTVVQPSGPAGASPATTRPASGGTGLGLTVGITWAAATALALNPSAGPTTVGGTLTVTGTSSHVGNATFGSGAQNILTVVPGATSANAVNFQASATGTGFFFNAPVAVGTGNISVTSGSVTAAQVFSSGVTLMQAGTVTGTNNVIRLQPTAAGTAPSISVVGPDANQNLAFNVQGTGGFQFNGRMGFNSTAPIAKPSISGSRGGNAALASLLTALANYGLVTDTTTA